MTNDVERFSLRFDQDWLACYKIRARNGASRGSVILLHGAGTADKERMIDLSHDIARAGYDVASMDFSGHGESSGFLKRQSLERRYMQARALIDATAPDSSPLTLVGFSMSGQTVGDLVDALQHRVATIGLCSPAIYTRESWAVRFDAGFTDIIRQPESWRNSHALNSFARFEGRAVLAVPQNDPVIPAGVTAVVSEALLRRAEFSSMVFHNAPHQLGLYFKENEVARRHFILELLGEPLGPHSHYLST